MNSIELETARQSLEQTIHAFNEAKEKRNIADLATAAHAFSDLHAVLGDNLLVDATANTCLLIADLDAIELAINVAAGDALWIRALGTTRTNSEHLFQSAFECLSKLTVKANAKEDLESASRVLSRLNNPRVTDDPVLRLRFEQLSKASITFALKKRNYPVVRDMAEDVGVFAGPLDDLNTHDVSTLLNATGYALREEKFNEAMSCVLLANKVAQAETSPDSPYREAIVGMLVHVYKTCAGESANISKRNAHSVLGTAYTILSSMPELRDSVTSDLLGWARQAVDDNKIEQALETATLVFSHEGKQHINARSPHRHTIFNMMGNIAGKALKTIESPENALNLVFHAMKLAKAVDPFFYYSDAKTREFAHHNRLLLNSAQAALDHNVPTMAHEMAVLAVDMEGGEGKAAPETLSTASTLCLDAAVMQMPNSKELGYALDSLDKAMLYATTPDQQSRVMHRLFQFAGEALAEKNPHLVIRAMRWIADDNGQYQSPDHKAQYRTFANEIVSFVKDRQCNANPIEQMLTNAYEDNDTFNAREQIKGLLTGFVGTMAELPEETPDTCQRDETALSQPGTIPNGKFAPK